MFVEDLRNDFYNVLLGNRVLLLVHYDVDAICTCKILQNLFKCDNISYTLVPVGGVSELKSAFEENNEEIKYVVLVNCGGTIDLVDILQPEEEVVFFVLDSHKPSDICNVYSDGQVRLVYKDSEENIPNFDDIFRDDDEEEEEQQLESGLEAMESLVAKRRERREWEEKRHTLMFNYTQFSYHGKPSACVALELAWMVSRCGVAELWASSVAVSAHTALCLRPPAQCLLDSELLARRLASVQHKSDPSTCAVVLEKDAWLPLYRGWSLEAALRHAPGLAPHLRLHSLAGEARLRRLLADMGFPLQQARQAFRSMDVELRGALVAALEAGCARGALPAPARAALLLRRPRAHPRAAHDAVYALLGLIEHETIPRGQGFQHALAALEITSGNEELKLGEESARAALQGINSALHSILASRKLLLAGPFRYCIVPEGSCRSGPHWLGVLARWAAAASGSRPLVAAADLPGGTCLLLGVPPSVHTEPRSLFGAAFEQAATKSGVSISLDLVDSSVITLPIAQRTQFLDALTALLA